MAVTFEQAQQEMGEPKQIGNATKTLRNALASLQPLLDQANAKGASRRQTLATWTLWTHVEKLIDVLAVDPPPEL